MIRLALAQALLPEAVIRLRGDKGRFIHVPDLKDRGRLLLTAFATVNAIAAIVALWPQA